MWYYATFKDYEEAKASAKEDKEQGYKVEIERIEGLGGTTYKVWTWIDESLKEEKINYNVDDNGVLHIYLGDKILSDVSDCGGMDDHHLLELVADTLYGLGYDWKEDGTISKIEESLTEAEEDKKDDTKEPKLETFEDKMDFLAKDEQEAIDGYDKVIAMLDKEQDAFVIEQLTKIKVEEEAHKKYLEDVKTNKELEYTEPLEQDELEEGKTSAQKYNDMLHRTFEMAKKANLAMKDFLIKNGVSEEEAEKLYQDTGLHGSPLQQKLIDMGLKDEFFSKYDYSKGVMKESKQIKEAQEGFTTFLNLECGVLLEEDHPEFKDYSVAYDHKHGYYDETYLNSLEGDLELLKESGLDYIKKGVNGTYAILTKVDVQGSMEDDFIKDAIKDIEDGMYIDNSIEFLDGEQFKASNVIWSAYKDENGEIHENFVDTSVTEECKKELKEYNLPKDAKPYKTCGDKEYYIATFDDVDRAMMGNKATHTIVTKKVGGDFDMGSASGLDFNSEEEAKKWIDDACSLKEDVSDEVASKLQALYDEGRVYFDLAKDKDGDDFLIVDGWEDVRKIQKALKPDFEPKDEYDTSVLDELFDNGYQWGFRDEYSKCDRCGKVIRTEADSYSWVPDFFVTEDGEIICGDCVRENPKEYLETLYNNPEKANTILSAQDLIDNGFEKIDGDYEDGWYDKHDSPEEILNKALEAHPNGVFIFHISGQGQFATQFELWGADLDLDESKKKDIKEENEDHYVVIYYEDGSHDISYGDYDKSCKFYDEYVEKLGSTIESGKKIVKVLRYSENGCEESKSLEGFENIDESLKESYKENDLIEFEDDAPMTFGDIVEMMYNRLSKEDNLVENLEEEALKCAKNFIEEKGGHKATKDAEK